MFETPFNISCYYGDNLQDYPNNPAEMRQAVDYWEAQLTQPELDIRDRIRLLTRIGTYARTLRDLDRAEEAHKAAIELAKSIDNVRLKTQNRIKLAHVYQWQQQYAESEAVFEAMIATCQHEPEVADFLDFAYQHYITVYQRRMSGKAGRKSSVRLRAPSSKVISMRCSWPDRTAKRST
jgi:tetratricopeptide (TPR) repeat protein